MSLCKLLPHLLVVVLAIGVAYYFRIFPFHVEEKGTIPGDVSLRGKSEAEIIQILLKRKHRVETICNSNNTCFAIIDSFHMEDDIFIVRRNLVNKANAAFSITGVELEKPETITWKNVDTHQWRVNKLVVEARYAKMMIAAGFFMESLSFDEGTPNEVLMAGLGGGVMSNFLSQLDYLNITTTVVEVDPYMVELAEKWFGHKETEHLKVVQQDFATFLDLAIQDKKRYDLIIVDACHNEATEVLCPIESLRDEEKIRNMQAILSESGTITINVCTMQDQERHENAVLSEYNDFFNTCYLLKYISQRKMLICSNRLNWSWEENVEIFMQNLELVDKIFDFHLYNVYK